MALEKEWDTYQKELPKLVVQAGKFVLIAGEDVIDTFDSYDDGMKQGYKTFGLDTPFMVQQISAVEPTQYFSRPLELQCPI